MGKYYGLVSRAVAGIDSKAARQDVYDRARQLQSSQLVTAMPPLSDLEIKRERAALEDAILRAESEANSKRSKTDRQNRLPTRSKTQRLLSGFAFSIIAIQAALLSWLIFVPIPSTAEIDSDLVEINGEIKNASIESEKYSSSLIKNLIDLRKQMLTNTAAMLAQKKDSILRRVTLEFRIDGARIEKANESELAQIKEDISQAEQKLDLSKKEADQYAGGLIQAMALTTVETNKLTVSELQLKFYSAKYGIPLFFSQSAAASKQPPINPDSIAKDRDAL